MPDLSFILCKSKTKSKYRIPVGEMPELDLEGQSFLDTDGDHGSLPRDGSMASPIIKESKILSGRSLGEKRSFILEKLDLSKTHDADYSNRKMTDSSSLEKSVNLETLEKGLEKDGSSFKSGYRQEISLGSDASPPPTKHFTTNDHQGCPEAKMQGELEYKYIIRDKPSDLDIYDNRSMILKFEGSSIEIDTDYLAQEKFKFMGLIKTANLYLWCGHPVKKTKAGSAKNVSIFHKIPFTFNMVLASVLSTFKISIDHSKFILKEEVLEAFFVFFGNIQLISAFTRLMRVFYEKEKSPNQCADPSPKKRPDSQQRKLRRQDTQQTDCTLDKEEQRESIFVRTDLVPLVPRKISVTLRKSDIELHCNKYKDMGWNISGKDVILITLKKLCITRRMYREGPFISPTSFSTIFKIQISRISSHLKNKDLHILDIENLSLQETIKIEKFSGTINH